MRDDSQAKLSFHKKHVQRIPLLRIVVSDKLNAKNANGLRARLRLFTVGHDVAMPHGAENLRNPAPAAFCSNLLRRNLAS
jgi:hypothetical protein